jgi:outer membrane protein OmpA-like peptidoglycan-associated protein
MRTIAGLAAALILAGACTTTSHNAARDKLVATPPRCADQTVSIYFEPYSAEITPEGKMVIAQASQGAAGCKVTAIDVIGLADAQGAPDANLELSKKRADAVAAVLASDGLPAAQFKLGAVGGAGAVTPGGQNRPLRRRADVTLHLAAR